MPSWAHVPVAPARPTAPARTSSTTGSSSHEPGEDVDLRVEVFVDLRADLIFNFEAPYRRRSSVVRSPRTTVQPRRAAARADPDPAARCGPIVGVRFHLGGLAPFTRDRLAVWSGQTPSPSWCSARVPATRVGAAAAPDLEAGAGLLDEFFLARLRLDAAQATFERALRRSSPARAAHGERARRRRRVVPAPGRAAVRPRSRVPAEDGGPGAAVPARAAAADGRSRGAARRASRQTPATTTRRISSGTSACSAAACRADTAATTRPEGRPTSRPTSSCSYKTPTAPRARDWRSDALEGGAMAEHGPEPGHPRIPGS